MMRARPTSRGFAAIAAIFLVVGLASLGAFMLTLSNTQQLTSAQDVQGTRAYWAARAGLEWAIAGVAATAPVAPAVLPLATCPVAAPPASVDGFTLAITCNPRAYTESGVTVTIFQISSVASIGTPGSIGSTERSVSASVER